MQALLRHPQVLNRLRREPAFPLNAAVGQSDVNHFWVVDHFEDGVTLRQHVTASGRSSGLPVSEVIDLMRQLIEALLVLHVKNIIRREFTPDSVLIRPDGSLLMTDMELCKLSSEYPTVRLMDLPTNPFVAPETKGPKIDESVDVYGWGKLFLFAATGKEPPEFVSISDTELRGYPKRIRHLLQCSTSHSYRSRPSAAEIVGVLQGWDLEG